ncbi:MAG: N-acetylmuramoyl-L-alanine amidase [Clostridiales bacterium]|nr:N-acetylmuramoyl-L-alanine amidase [Clostridiales bacterium]
MIFKRKYLILCICVILCAFAALSVTYGVKAAAADGGRVVVVDAGHGGRDGGVTGKVTGVRESDLNLKYAFLLKASLEKQGFKVIMTRTTEAGLYDAAAALSEESRKSQDMKRRKEIILNSKPACVISLHMNFFSQSSPRGAQVFYNASNPESKKLSAAIQNKLNIVNGEYAGKKISNLPGDYYMIKCTDYSSVIIECGFLSNADDERLLLNEAYQSKLIYEITNGVLVYCFR